MLSASRKGEFTKEEVQAKIREVSPNIKEDDPHYETIFVFAIGQLDAGRRAEEEKRKAEEEKREKEEAQREKEEMKRRAEEEKREKEEAQREKEEMKRRAEEEKREKEEAQREKEEMKRRAEEEKREKEEAQREKEEMKRRAEEEKREKEEAQRETQEEKRRVEELKQRVEESDQKEEELKRELKKALELQNQRHRNYQEELKPKMDKLDQRHDRESKGELTPIGTILAEKPCLLKKLVPTTWDEKLLKATGEKQRSSSKKSKCSVTDTTPPHFAHLLIQAKTGTADWKLFKEKKTESMKLYQHVRTGHLLPAEHQPTASMKSCLEAWTDADFGAHLASADHASIDGVKIWPLLLSAGLSDMLAEMARGDHDVDRCDDQEKNVEIALDFSIFFLLRRLFNIVLTQLGKCSFHASTDALGSVRPSLRSRRKIDRALEIVLDGLSIALIIFEAKVHAKFPCNPSDVVNKEAAIEKIREHLLKFFLDTDIGKEIATGTNPFAQIRTYLGMYHRRFGILSTLNCWTFVELNEDGMMKVSKRFHANQANTNVPDAKTEYSLLEMIMRFIVASIGEWTSGEKPTDVFPARPVFIQEWAKSRFKNVDPDADYDPTIKRTDESIDESGNGLESTPKEPEEEPRSGQRRSARLAAQGKKTEAAASSVGKERRNAMGPQCWADLEDPRRNDPTAGELTWQEHLSALGDLEGDAKVLGHGRTGWTMRKEFDGVDMAIKLFQPGTHLEDDEPSNEELLQEMRNEAAVYKRLEKLQGDVIPRFFGMRDLYILGIHALSTEFVGVPFVYLDKVDETKVRLAIEALDRIHEAGVLHGDVRNTGNIIWDSMNGKASWIDFGFSESREVHYQEEDLKWAQRCTEERRQCLEKLQDLLVPHDSVASSSSLSTPLSPPPAQVKTKSRPFEKNQVGAKRKRASSSRRRQSTSSTSGKTRRRSRRHQK